MGLFGSSWHHKTPARLEMPPPSRDRQDKTSRLLLFPSSAVSLPCLPLVQPTQKQLGQIVWEIYFVLHGKGGEWMWQQTGKWPTHSPTPWKFSPGHYSCLSSILSLYWDLHKLIFITSLLQQLPAASSTPPKLPTMLYRALCGPASANLPSPISSHSPPWSLSSNPKAVFQSL